MAGLISKSTAFLFSKPQKGEPTIIRQRNAASLGPYDIKMLIESSLDKDKAEEIITVPLTDQSALADYMIIATGTSSRHVNALATKIREKLHKNGITEVNIEGLSQGDWVVIDAGDVIVHLFRPEVRAFYNIEKMWCAHPAFDVISTQIQA